MAKKSSKNVVSERMFGGAALALVRENVTDATLLGRVCGDIAGHSKPLTMAYVVEYIGQHDLALAERVLAADIMTA